MADAVFFSLGHLGGVTVLLFKIKQGVVAKAFVTAGREGDMTLPAALADNRCWIAAVAHIDNHTLIAGGALFQGRVCKQFKQFGIVLLVVCLGAGKARRVDAGRTLQEVYLKARVVSMPCMELFAAQSQEYRDLVLPPTCRARP